MTQRWWAALAASLVIACPLTGWAQGPLLVRGKVVRQTLDGVRPVAREQVTLHRVNAKEAGAIDSLVTDASGSYSFRVATPDSQSMYLASARYAGIAYFSSPAQPGAPANAPSEIVVYDTTSADVRMQMQGRHVVVSAPNADGVRSVIDVLEISNDTVLTRVAGDGNRPTYSLLLPAGAEGVSASQGDLTAGAVEVRNGRADILMPLSPGLRQVVLTYTLPAKAYPVAIPLERSVSVLEVLLEEKGATAEGAGLVDKGGVSVDGKAFERYLGQNAPAAGVVTLRAPGSIRGTSLPSWVVPAALGLLTLGVIVLFTRRAPGASATTSTASSATGGARPAPVAAALSPDERPAASPVSAAAATPAATPAVVPAAVAEGDDVTVLARRIAAVDAVLAGTALADNARADLTAHRAELKGELLDALARRTPVR